MECSFSFDPRRVGYSNRCKGVLTFLFRHLFTVDIVNYKALLDKLVLMSINVYIFYFL